MSAPYYLNGDRVTVSDTADRWYGEHGRVEDFHFGFTGQRVYHVRLDRAPLESFTYYADELDLGESIYA